MNPKTRYSESGPNPWEGQPGKSISLDLSKPVTRPVEDIMIHVVHSRHGIYSPQIFVDQYYPLLEKCIHIAHEDLDTVCNGPDHEYYWESWEMIEYNAVLTDDDGVRWTIYQDEGIYLVREDITDEERESTHFFMF